MTRDSRPFITNGDVSVAVGVSGGEDYTSIQAALDDMSIYGRYKCKITDQDGDYSREDVVVYPMIANDFQSRADYERGNPPIIGNMTIPLNVGVNSLSAGASVDLPSVRTSGVSNSSGRIRK